MARRVVLAGTQTPRNINALFGKLTTNKHSMRFNDAEIILRIGLWNRLFYLFDYKAGIDGRQGNKYYSYEKFIIDL